MLHAGDNRTGDGEGDDESIAMTIKDLDPIVTQLFVFVTLFQGGNFKQLEDVFVRMMVKTASDGGT
jgi:stress response protein SCP2